MGLSLWKCLLCAVPGFFPDFLSLPAQTGTLPAPSCLPPVFQPLLRLMTLYISEACPGAVHPDVLYVPAPGGPLRLLRVYCQADTSESVLHNIRFQLCSLKIQMSLTPQYG